jgi:glycosyltransferase involved in cell wall biosynthesis
MKSVLVLSYAEGFNGTAVHQHSFRKLFRFLPEYEFTVLEHPKQLKGRKYDAYLNLTPPYNVKVNGDSGSSGNFYYFATDWIKKSPWLTVKKGYRFLPSTVRRNLGFLKQAVFRSFIGVFPPPESWVTLCHDLTPVIRREWFAFPPEWEIDFLGNFLKSKHVIAVSESTRRDLIRHGMSHEKVSVVYNTTDENFNLEKRKFRPPIRDYILAVGSFEPRKNLANLYEAFCKIRSRVPHDLVLIGSDRWGDQSICERVQRDSRCHVIGRVLKEDLVGWYQGARALAYVSWYEGFGLPILEAAGCGLPVVCSGNSGMLEAGDGYAEFTDPANPDDIAEKLLKALSPGYRVDAIARQRLLTRFSAEENAKRLKSVLDKISA